MGFQCERLHQLFHQMPKKGFPFEAEAIPQNGIYILFEKGETGHRTERIVRIGTHTGVNQLRSRLLKHFIKGKKDRSIFRKNIGRALLNRDHDPFLEQWEIDITSRQARETYQHTIDFDNLKRVEERVSKTIQENFHFVAIRVDHKDERAMWKEKLVSTVSFCTECRPSITWLGRYSPVAKIRESGLWNVQGLYKTMLSEKELDRLAGMIRRS